MLPPELEGFVDTTITQPLVEEDSQMTLSVVEHLPGESITVSVSDVPGPWAYLFVARDPGVGICWAGGRCLDIAWSFGITGALRSYYFAPASYGTASWTLPIGDDEDYAFQAISYNPTTSLVDMSNPLDLENLEPEEPNILVTSVEVSLYTACATVLDLDTLLTSIACWGMDRNGSISDAPSVPGQYYNLVGGDWAAFCVTEGPGNEICWGDGVGIPTDAQLASDQLLHLDIPSLGPVCGTTVSGEVICYGGDSLATESFPDDGFYQVQAGYHTTCANYKDIDRRSEWLCIGELDGDPDWSRVDTGVFQVCGLHSDAQTITCNGDGFYTDGLDHGFEWDFGGTVRDIAINDLNLCVRDFPGYLTCIGNNGNGLQNTPEGAFYKFDISMGYGCGITTEWTVECWGGEANTQPWNPVTSVPDGLR